MEFFEILYVVDGPVAMITLNRPEKLNAYTARMGAELAQAVNQASRDDAVRAVILTGAGRGFCAGADISAGADSFDTTAGGAGGKNFGAGGDRAPGGGFVQALFECEKPIIAAFNGPAVGVGVTLALPTDIKIASSSARFGFIFARRGLVPEAGSAWFLPQLVGLSQALRWCLTGRIFDAQEALAGGLVSEVVEPEALLPRAKAIALEIAENCAPVSLALTRQMLWRFGPATSPAELLKLDGGFAMTLGQGGDVREGVSAFLEKRPPQFPGRVSTDMPSAYPWW
ncbi:enoyl-CoA hydratase-related protein [Phenylobacterium montanum]|uniref:Enoyl-CoA hydratase/isomerase family protein n=1 Tax=Phenylobacterium montanum TaxID=2823693 RepID=A0A975G1K4_9CAUL|nr:enoyl-CoA hydratase-related protein [Caulobacter sp. S6]QUD88914.1 enoyl-CoA hydratase/isomerase family protein [Caulobacter sp. S6]